MGTGYLRSCIGNVLIGLAVIVCGNTLHIWAQDSSSKEVPQTWSRIGAIPSAAVGSESKKGTSERWSREWL